MDFYEWSPGNGTRYFVAFHKVTEEDAKHVTVSAGGWIVCFPDGLFKSYAFQPGGALDLPYVQSKLGIKLGGDAEAIVQLLGHVMKRQTKVQWLKCIECGLPIHPDIKRAPMCVGCEWKLPEMERYRCICGEPLWRHGTYGECLEPECKCEKFRRALCEFCGMKYPPHAFYQGRLLCKECYHIELDSIGPALPPYNCDICGHQGQLTWFLGRYYCQQCVVTKTEDMDLIPHKEKS